MEQARTIARVTAWLLLAGCGEVITTPDAALDPNRITSGTRLKVRWYDYGGGARATAGLYDAERAESCRFATWSDGSLSCVPIDTAEAVYTDAQCTQLAGRASSCDGAPPAYVLELATVACSSTVKKLFERGPKLAATEYYIADYKGACVGPFTDAEASYYLPGTEVPASRLVPLSLDEPDRTVRLSAPAYTSPDGARFRSSMYDSELDTRCFFSLDHAEAGTGVCAPASAAGTSLFVDATCSVPVMDTTSACPTPAYVQQLTRPECPSSPATYRRVGASVSVQTVYAGAPGSCSATTTDPGTSLYLLGDEVQLAPVSRVRDTGAAPLQVIRYVAGTLTFRDGSLYDNTLGAECRTRGLADGTYRCLPSSPSAQPFFTNAACTQAIDLVEVFSSPASCGAPVLPAFVSRTLPPPAGSCVSGRELHMIGAEYTGPLFQSFGMCVAVPTGGSRFYQVGRLLPMSQFPQAQLVTDE